MVEIYVIRDLTRAKKCKIDDWGFEYIQGSSYEYILLKQDTQLMHIC